MTDDQKPQHPDQTGRWASEEEANAWLAPFTLASLMYAFHKRHHEEGGTAMAGVVAVPSHTEGHPPTTGFAAVGDHTDPDPDCAIGVAMTIDDVTAVTWMSTDTATRLIALVKHAIDTYEAGRLVDGIGMTDEEEKP